MSDDGETTGTARTVAFRCPADLEALLTKSAADLGVSVSRAIDGLLREGIDTRATKQREEQIAQRLEGALARLEFVTQRVTGRNQFDDESMLLGFALLEFERGKRRLLGLLNSDVFSDAIHRWAWKTLPALLNVRDQDNTASSDKPMDVADLLAQMCREEEAAAKVAAIIGSLHGYFELIMLRSRWAEKHMPGRVRAMVADAIRGVVGEALQQFVEPDPHHAANFAKAREVSLVNLTGERLRLTRLSSMINPLSKAKARVHKSQARPGRPKPPSTS